MSFSNVLKRTMGLKALGKSYKFLLSVILIIFFKYTVSLMISLRCLYDNLSEPGVDELLHLLIELTNSASENGSHFIECLFEILSSRLMSI